MRYGIILFAAAAALAATTFSSCSGSGGFGSGNDSIKVKTADISELDVNVNLLSTAKSYDIILAQDSMHLVMSASVQWPTKIGKHDLTAFQDSILTFAFPQYKDGDVRSCMSAYVNDVKSTGLVENGATVTNCQEAYPDDVNNYSCDIDARVLEFSDKMITYQIVETTYLGGAHPNTASRSITYDFVNSTLLSISNVIKPESIPEFAEVVKRNMLQQLDITEGDFEQMMLVPKFQLGKDLFIGDGSIYIHYNTYELLPHSFGTIDVMVSPYEIQDMLTPMAKDLLVEE